MMSDDELSKRAALDETLLEYLSAGWSHEQAAAAAGVSSKTVQRRVAETEFAALLGRRRALHTSALTARLSSITDGAVDVIVGSFESENPAVRLRAADLALSWATRMRREVDLEARVARLESPEHGDSGGDS